MSLPVRIRSRLRRCTVYVPPSGVVWCVAERARKAFTRSTELHVGFFANGSARNGMSSARSSRGEDASIRRRWERAGRRRMRLLEGEVQLHLRDSGDGLKPDPVSPWNITR